MRNCARGGMSSARLATTPTSCPCPALTFPVCPYPVAITSSSSSRTENTVARSAMILHDYVVTAMETPTSFSLFHPRRWSDSDTDLFRPLMDGSVFFLFPFGLPQLLLLCGTRNFSTDVVEAWSFCWPLPSPNNLERKMEKQLFKKENGKATNFSTSGRVDNTVV
jgi:hypothetical protein